MFGQIGSGSSLALLHHRDQYVGEARTFMASLGEAQAPAPWEAELANVFWMATRHKDPDNRGSNHPIDFG
jgi:hypothetical protein